MSSTRPYSYKEGTFLYEQDRLRSCGLPKVPINVQPRSALLTPVSGHVFVSLVPLARHKVHIREQEGPMRIGEIERVGERKIPIPNLTPQAPPQRAPSPPAPQRKREPHEPERVL
jgi:hypothetical protein